MPRKQPVPADLSLVKLPEPPEHERVALRLPKPVLAKLAAYGDCYKALRGKAIEPDVLVALILDTHFSNDRAFKAWLAKAGVPVNASMS